MLVLTLKKGMEFWLSRVRGGGFHLGLFLGRCHDDDTGWTTAEPLTLMGQSTKVKLIEDLLVQRSLFVVWWTELIRHGRGDGAGFILLEERSSCCTAWVSIVGLFTKVGFSAVGLLPEADMMGDFVVVCWWDLLINTRGCFALKLSYWNDLHA